MASFTKRWTHHKSALVYVIINCNWLTVTWCITSNYHCQYAHLAAVVKSGCHIMESSRAKPETTGSPMTRCPEQSTSTEKSMSCVTSVSLDHSKRFPVF